MNALELADKLQDYLSEHHFGTAGELMWDGGAMLRNLHTENTALRCTEMALRDEIAELRRQLSAAPAQPEQPAAQGEPLGYVYSWIHSSATGKPDETFTGFTKSIEDAKRHPAHFDIHAVYTHQQQASKPMTDSQLTEYVKQISGCALGESYYADGFIGGFRAAERFHKIGEGNE